MHQGLHHISRRHKIQSTSSLYYFSRDIYLKEISKVLPQNSLILKKLKILGTLYTPGMVAVIEKRAFGVLKVGILRVIAFQDEQVFFGFSTLMAIQSRYNFYVSTEDLDKFETKSYDELHDYYPLTRIGSTSSFRFALHHYISSAVRMREYNQD